MSRWIPLESNPKVLNSSAEKLGLVLKQAHFEDIYGLDEELLTMVEQPVRAVLLLFPISEASEADRQKEDAKIAKDGQEKIDPTLFWIKQTIPNACGTIGLLHALLNSKVTFSPESPIILFMEESINMTPEERSKLLESTQLVADIHAEAASSGQSAVPANLDTNLHFTCFVHAPSFLRRETHDKTASMRLVELDGRRAGPIDRGECSDLLQGVAKFVKEKYMARSTSIEFSMVALCGH